MGSLKQSFQTSYSFQSLENTSLKALYNDSREFSNIFVIGPPSNSTYELYIKHRISADAREKLHLLESASLRGISKKHDLKNSLVIINRYVDSDILNWLEQNRKNIKAVIWVVDDDFSAMVLERDVPFIKKYKPLQTIFFQNRMKNVVDHLLVSSEHLAASYSDWPTIITPPLALNIEEKKPLDTTRLYYFSKMHSREHEFIYPIVKTVLEQKKEANFTVVANGKWFKKWSKLERVNVFTEMSFARFQQFQAEMPAAGIFLVPLSQSKLNLSRSDSKIIQVAQMSSASLVSKCAAYSEFNSYSHKKGMLGQGLPANEEAWIKAIYYLMENHDTAVKNAQIVASFVEDRYQKHFYIV